MPFWDNWLSGITFDDLQPPKFRNRAGACRYLLPGIRFYKDCATNRYFQFTSLTTPHAMRKTHGRDYDTAPVTCD